MQASITQDVPPSLRIDSFLSDKLIFWSFVSMVLLVFVHGYNLDQRYLQPWTIPGEPLTLTSFVEYFFANGIFRFRIPMLFAISGYLYALHDQQRSYNERTVRRLRSLGLPYVLWSAIALGLTYLLELIPYTNEMIASSHVLQIDETRLLLHDYTWQEIVQRWIFSPVAYQLWFIRVLLVYNIAYPAIRWCVLHPVAQKVFFTITTLLWIATAGFFFFEGEGLLFFGLGVRMQKRNFDVKRPGRLFNPLNWSVVFFVAVFIKTWLAFRGLDLIGNGVEFILLFLHKISIIAGLITCWYGLDGAAIFFMKRSWFRWSSGFSFFIYALHAPFVAFFIYGFLALTEQLPYNQLITFFLLPLTIVVVCITIGFMVRGLFPRAYRVLTGGRGV